MSQAPAERNDVTLATVASSTRITPESTAEVRQIILNADTSSHYFPAGQSIAVIVPGPHPHGIKEYQRLYTIAKSSDAADGHGAIIELLVRRCSYIDDFSGEEYPGIASNYLCDAKPGDPITLTGPHRSPFRIPADPECNLLMLGTGTGIAPFRAFMRRIYDERQGWKGKVRLYFGANKGTEMLYMNDLNNDLGNYYDQDTFKAIQAVRSSMLQDEEDALRRGIVSHADDVWKLISDPKTHVYLAGLSKIADALDESLSEIAGSPEKWHEVKQQLVAEQRWSELIYD
jgi:ferredoxin--NADP+ reductase